jgi:peptidoglycan/xylan/chitin deacetylase (PgdA/CDA1 family)
MRPWSILPNRLFRRVLAIAVGLSVLALGLTPGPVAAAADDCTAGWVALTYDDGPRRERTDAILAALERTNTRATFFFIGRRVAQNPDLALEVAGRGHAIANHTWAHVNLRFLSNPEIISSVQRTDVALRAIGIQPLRLVRPPFLLTNAGVRDALGGAGCTQALPTVNPRDWRSSSSADLVDRVVRRARDGSVIVLHDGGRNYDTTAVATEGIVDRLAADGFCFGVLNRNGDIVAPVAVGASYRVPAVVTVDEKIWIDYLMSGTR